MPINFPNSPSPNQQYTYDNKTWEWNGTYWEVYSALTSYITSAYTVGNGYSDISGVTGGNIVLKSFSGVNINIIDGGDKLTFSGDNTDTYVTGFTYSNNTFTIKQNNSQPDLTQTINTVTGLTINGNLSVTGTTSSGTISATTYQNLPFSGTVTGGGTTNYVPKWTGSTGLGNSQIFDDGTNVGIGTTSPSAKLDVISPTSGSTPILRVSGASSVEAVRITQTGGGFALVVEDDTNPDSTSFVVDSAGRVGIGYGTGTTLGQNLTVNGIGVASTSFIAPTFQGTTLYPQNDVNLNIRTRDGGAGNRDILFGTGNSGGTPFTRMTIASTGNVGIGTTSPSARLDVSGDTLLRSGVTLSNLSSSANTRFIVSDSNGVLSYRTDVLTGTTITISGGTGITTGGTYPNFTITNSAPDQTVTISGGTGITTGGTYPNFTLVNSAPDQTVTISGGTGITTGGTYPNFTITNSSPDQTVTITGGTNIQINGTYPNFGVDFTGGTILKYYISATTPTGVINNGDRWFNTTDGVELVYVTDGDGPQWVQPNNGGSNTGTTSGGDYLPLSGGTVTGNTTFSSGVALNALTSSEEINNIVADSAGNLYTYTDGVTISAGADPAVNSGMFKTNRIVDIGGTFYRVYNIKANITVPGANNTFVNYIGVVSGSTNYTPSLTKSLVTAQDPTFNRVQTSLTTYALVYDETLLFAAPVDLMTVNYDNTLGNPDEYYIFSIAANTNNFSCDLQVDYEFLVLETDVITFTN